MFGRRPDGKFVKYFDTRDLVKSYFGDRQEYSLEQIHFLGNQILIDYKF